MLHLHFEPETSDARTQYLARLDSEIASKSLLYVVSSRLQQEELKRRAGVDGERASRIVTLDEFLIRLGGRRRTIVDEQKRRVLVRQLAMRDDRLASILFPTSEDGELKLSPTTLTAVTRDVEKLRSGRGISNEGFGSPSRQKALAALAGRVSAELEAIQASDRAADALFLGNLQKISESDFSNAFPEVDLIAFDGFWHAGEAAKEAIRLCSRHVQCAVLVSAWPEIGRGSKGTVMELLGQSGHEQESKEIQEDLFAAPSLPENLSLIECHDRKEEVRSVCAAISRLADEGTLNCFQAVICVSSLSRYSSLIQDAFTDYNLPLNMDQGTSVVGHPLWEHLARLGAISVSISFSALRELTKSPYSQRAFPTAQHVVTLLLDRVRRNLGFPRDLITLEKQISDRISLLNSRSRFEAEDEALDFDDSATTSRDDEFSELQAVNEFISAVKVQQEQVAGKRPIAEWAQVVRTLISACLPEGDAAITQEDCQPRSVSELIIQERVAEVILHACEDISVLLGSSERDQVIGFPDYIGHLRTMLYRVTVSDLVSSEPGVIVAEWDQLAAMDRPVVYVVGCLDGEFPPPSVAHTETASLLPAAFPTAQKLYLFYPQMDGQEELLRSAFLDDLELVHGLTAQPFEQAFGFPVSAVDCGTSIKRAAITMTEATATNGSSVLSPREEKILRHCAWNIAANRERTRTDGVCELDGFIRDPALKAVLAKIAEQKVFSITQLDVLVQCRFRYFVERILKITQLEEEEDQVPPHIQGQIIHEILFSFYTRWKSDGGGKLRADDNDRAWNLMQKVAIEILNANPFPEFDRHLLERKLFGCDDADEDCVRGYIGILRAFLDLEIARSEVNDQLLEPTFFETGFGLFQKEAVAYTDPISVEAPVELEMGTEKIRVRGRVDRVDANGDVFSLIDYKTGKPPTISSQTSGIRVQIPVYLMALEKLFMEKGIPMEPAGGAFCSLTPSAAKMEGQFFREAYRSVEALGARQRLLSEEAYRASIESVKKRIALGVSEARKGNFYVTMLDEKHACSYCACEAACRKDLERNRQVVPLVSEQWGLEGDLE